MSQPISTRRRQLVAAALILHTCHAFPLSQPWPSAPASFARHKKSSLVRYQLHALAIADITETSSLQVSHASARLDPLLTSFLIRSVRKNAGQDLDIKPIDGTHHFFTFSDASEAMLGLQIWETSLRKARLPLIEDFRKDQNVWPEEPLFSHVYDVLSELGLPRLVRRHPEILTSVLLGVAKVVMGFIQAQRQGKLVFVEDNIEEEEDCDLEDLDTAIDLEDIAQFAYEPLSMEEMDQLADSLANNLKQEWGGVVQGVASLDKVFGYDHGLLDLQVSGHHPSQRNPK